MVAGECVVSPGRARAGRTVAPGAAPGQNPGMSEPRTPRVELLVQVMFYDTDCAAVVHNLAYLRHIETARTLLAEQLGWQLAGMSETGLYPVVLRTEIDYKRPARLGDQLLVDGTLESIERMRFWCRFEIVRPSDGVRMVSCRQSLALIQMPGAKPVRLPADWRHRYAHLYRPATGGSAGEG